MLPMFCLLCVTTVIVASLPACLQVGVALHKSLTEYDVTIHVDVYAQQADDERTAPGDFAVCFCILVRSTVALLFTILLICQHHITTAAHMPRKQCPGDTVPICVSAHFRALSIKSENRASLAYTPSLVPRPLPLLIVKFVMVYDE